MLFHTLPTTPGQVAALARVAQLTDTRWTPVRDIPSFTRPTGKLWHKAGETVTGLPYSSPEPTDSFLIENYSLNTFFSALANPDSALYTKDLGGIRNSWTYIAIVCNGLVRYAYGITRRYSTKRWLDIPGIHQVALPGQYTVDDIQLCDALYAFGQGRNHVAIISDILRDENGKVAFVEVSEAIAPRCRKALFTPEEYYEKYALFGLTRYDYLDQVTMPEPIEMPAKPPVISVDYGDRSNYFRGEPVVLSVFAEGPQQVLLQREDGPTETLTVTGKVSLEPAPGWYTATHVESGESVHFCVCRPIIEYRVEDGILHVTAKSTDPKSRVAWLDLREGSRNKVPREQLPPEERDKPHSATAAALAQVLELTEEEKETGIFSRPIHPDAKNFKVCYQNPYGIWTHTMLPLE